MKHLRLPGSRKHTARHHSCKMSSGASSKAERLTLIHKQLPLSLCCRFRTAVPPNISLSCLANIEKKTARLLSLLRNKGRFKRREEKAAPHKSREEAKRQRRKRAEGNKGVQYLFFYVNEIAGRHTNVSVNGSEAFLPLQGNP